MKTVSVSVDEATWQAAALVAAAQHTTLDAMVAGFVKNVAAQEPEVDEQEDARQRAALVEALKACGAIVGEKPTRERTYSDRRFHCH